MNCCCARYGKFSHLKRSLTACRVRCGHTEVNWHEDTREAKRLEEEGEDEDDNNEKEEVSRP